MRRKRWRSLWLRAHRILGLFAGLPLLIIALSGSFNVYFFEIDELLNPHIVPRSSSVDDARSLDTAWTSLQKAYPQRPGHWRLDLPAHPGAALSAWYYAADTETVPYLSAPMVSIDPGTGAILAAREFYHETVVGWIYKLHMTLLLGDSGQTVAGVLAAVLMLSILTGLYLWWPGFGRLREGLRWKRCTNSARRRYDLHKLAGLGGSVVLFILGFTGFYFIYSDYVQPLITTVFTVHEDPTKDPPNLASTLGDSQIPPLQAIELATKVFPQAKLRSITTPQGKPGVYVVAFQQPGEFSATFPDSKVWVDQYSGHVLAIRDPKQFTWGETLLSLIYPLHNGEALGTLGRVLVCAVGTLPVLLYVTGLLRWLQKRRARTIRDARRTH